MTTTRLNIASIPSVYNTDKVESITTTFWSEYDNLFSEGVQQSTIQQEEEIVSSELKESTMALEEAQINLSQMFQSQEERFIAEKNVELEETVSEQEEERLWGKKIQEKQARVAEIQREIESLKKDELKPFIEAVFMMSSLSHYFSSKTEGRVLVHNNTAEIQQETRQLEQEIKIEKRTQTVFERTIKFANSQEQALDQILQKEKTLKVFQTIKTDMQQKTQALLSEAAKQDQELEEVIDEHQQKVLHNEYRIKHEDGEWYLYSPQWEKLKYDQWSYYAMIWKKGVVADTVWCLKEAPGGRNVFKLRNKGRGGWLHETNWHKLVNGDTHNIMVHSDSSQLADIKELYVELKSTPRGDNYCEMRFLMHGNYLTYCRYDDDRLKALSNPVKSGYRAHRWQFIKV